MKFREFEGGGVVGAIFRADFEGGVVDEVPWIRGGGSWSDSGRFRGGGVVDEVPWIRGGGVVGAIFPGRFRGGVVDEVPWIRGGG